MRDESGKAVGWFIYVSETIASARCYMSRPDLGRASRARSPHRRCPGPWRCRADGRLDPSLAPELSERHNFLYRRGHWTLAHSENAELMHALQRGDAFLSRLEGEWCLRFTE